MTAGRELRIGPVRITYANVMATIAVFMALGGGAYASVASSASVISPAVRAKNSTDQTIHSFAGTAVAFNRTVYDNDHMHSTTTHNTRLVAPIGGVYDITGNVQWSPSANGERDLWIERNGKLANVLAETTVEVNSASGPTDQIVETQMRLKKGDYVELWVYQGSGGDLTLYHEFNGVPWSPVFAMHYLGP